MRWTTFACFIARRHKGTSHSDSVRKSNRSSPWKTPLRLWSSPTCSSPPRRRCGGRASTSAFPPAIRRATTSGAPWRAAPRGGPGARSCNHTFVARVALLLRAKRNHQGSPARRRDRRLARGQFPFRYRKPRQETHCPLREVLFAAADAAKNPQCQDSRYVCSLFL